MPIPSIPQQARDIIESTHWYIEGHSVPDSDYYPFIQRLYHMLACHCHVPGALPDTESARSAWRRLEDACGWKVVESRGTLTPGMIRKYDSIPRPPDLEGMTLYMHLLVDRLEEIRKEACRTKDVIHALRILACCDAEFSMEANNDQSLSECNLAPSSIAEEAGNWLESMLITASMGGKTLPMAAMSPLRERLEKLMRNYCIEQEKWPTSGGAYDGWRLVMEALNWTDAGLLQRLIFIRQNYDARQDYGWVPPIPTWELSSTIGPAEKLLKGLRLMASIPPDRVRHIADRVRHIAEPGGKPIEEEILPPITEVDELILSALKRHHPRLLDYAALEAETERSRDTLRPKVNSLLELKIVHRPNGNKKGIGLTSMGKKLAEKLVT